MINLKSLKTTNIFYILFYTSKTCSCVAIREISYEKIYVLINFYFIIYFM